MRYGHCLIFVVLGCGLSAVGQPPEVSDVSAQIGDDHWQAYQVVIERSIFSRERGQDRPGPEPDVSPAAVEQGETESEEDVAPRPASSHFVLIGISLVGDRPAAVFEDRRDGTLHTAQPGDVLAERVLTGITLDSVTSEGDGQASTIELGQSLAGDVPQQHDRGAAARAEGESSPPAAEAGSESSPNDVATRAILERMRQRRQQELQP